MEQKGKNVIQFYKDNLLLVAKILRDDKQLGMFYRAVTSFIETGEQATFTDEQYLVQGLYDDMIGKLLFSDEKYQAKCRANALAAVIKHCKTVGFTKQAFIEYATKEKHDFTMEEISKHLQEFPEESKTEEIVTENDTLQDTEQDPAVKAWFTEIYRKFPPEKQTNNHFDYSFIKSLYDSQDVRLYLARAVDLYLNSFAPDKKQFILGAKRFFEEKEYDKWLQQVWWEEDEKSGRE